MIFSELNLRKTGLAMFIRYKFELKG